jgi:pyruvate/2-oxoglutarate dehydrogenase complex dihydrolipoamide acyltransferase (E2) component
VKHPIVIPHLGATGGDVRILAWHVAEGEIVKAGAILLTVETDKSTVEVEAFREGHLRRILVPAGSEKAPGTVIAWLTDTADEPLEIAALPEAVVQNAAKAAGKPRAAPPRVSVGSGGKA